MRYKSTTMKFILSTLLCAIVFATHSVNVQAQTAKKPKAKKQKATTGQKAPAAAGESMTKPAEIEKPDLNVQPKALESTAFKFPAFEEFTMPNGLHVYVVENHELPTVTLSLLMKAGEAYDPEGKEGVASMMGDMLGKGTDKHTGQQIAEALDGVGASLSFSTGGETMVFTGASLKKYSDLLFSMLGEQLTIPKFDAEEFEKLRKQYSASIANRRSNAMETAQALSRKVIYGFDNPLARREEAASIDAITRQDVISFHSAWIKPNNASIAIVGDVTAKEARELLTKHLSSWKRVDVPQFTMPPINTAPAGVYFVPRPGSVQSSVVICSPAPSRTSADWLNVDMTATYMGTSFGSILFSTLREKYSYTYSPFGMATAGARYNRIALGAEVRTPVTDSAIIVILREIKRLVAEGPEEDRLAIKVAAEVGQYRMSFERASNVASYLQSAWNVGIPLDDVKNEISKREQIGYGDVAEAAKKYLNMFDLRIIVVGTPDVREKLEQFGKVYDYTMELSPLKEEAFEPVSQSAADIATAYRNAIGGEAAVNAVQTVVMKGSASMTMQGREMKGTILRKAMHPNKEVVTIDLAVMKQTQITDGSKAWVSMGSGPASEADAEETKRIIMDARLFPVLSWKADGYTLTVKGKRAGQIVVDAVSPLGRKERYFFDATSMLLTRTEKEETTPQGPLVVTEKYSDYIEVSGVKFPANVASQNSIYSLAYQFEIQVNAPLTAADFEPNASK